MTETEEWLFNRLKFRVNGNHIETLETRKNFDDKEVPKGVRPATEQEIALWNLLVIVTNGQAT